MHLSAKPVPRFLGVGTTEFFPSEGSFVNLRGELPCQVNSGNSVPFEDFFVSRHGERFLSLLEFTKHSLVNEVGNDDVRAWTAFAYLSDNPLHSPNASLLGMTRILVVVDGEFEKEQVYGATGENVSLQAESTRGRAG